jgi:thiamine-phosphate pyrophosphorylase
MPRQFDLMVISSPTDLPVEVNTVIQFFENGLEYFHLRKPHWEPWQMSEFLKAIPVQYHARIIIHSAFQLAEKYSVKGIHLSEGNRKHAELFKKYKLVSGAFHSFDEIRGNSVAYDYIFLSPVFDSISKPGYKAGFNLNDIASRIKNLREEKPHSPKIIALGGISSENIGLVKQAGFAGAAVIGTLWSEGEPLKAFSGLQRSIRK